MNTVKMKPATLQHGALSCRRLATDAAAVARQVKATHPPAEVPPDAMSAVHDAMNQLQRSAIAVERQALFLHHSMLLGLAADAPSSSGPRITVPGLLSPWPHAKRGGGPLGVVGDVLGTAGDALKGGFDQAVGMVTGTVDTVATLGAVAAYHAGVADLIPGAKKKAKQFEAGMAYAIRHPEETLKRIGEDTVSYKLWKEGHYAEAIGHNVVAFASIFIIASKAGETAERVTTAAKSERTMAEIAKSERTVVRALKDQTSLLRPSKGVNAEAAKNLERAQIRQNVAEGQHATAKQVLERSQAEHQKMMDKIHDPKPPTVKETVKKTVETGVKVGGAGSAVLQDQQQQSQQKP